jgi:hypothetical protein
VLLCGGNKGHTLFFEIMGTMDRLTCYLAMLGGLTLLTCRLSPPFAMSGAVYGLGGEKAETPSTLHIMPGVASELSLWFSSVV